MLRAAGCRVCNWPRGPGLSPLSSPSFSSSCCRTVPYPSGCPRLTFLAHPPSPSHLCCFCADRCPLLRPERCGLLPEKKVSCLWRVSPCCVYVCLWCVCLCGLRVGTDSSPDKSLIYCLHPAQLVLWDQRLHLFPSLEPLLSFSSFLSPEPLL